MGVLEFSFEEDIQGMILQWEIWKYGELLEANVVAYGGTDTMQALYILHKQENSNDGVPKITWEMLDVGETGYSKFGPFIQIAFPECKDKGFGLSSSVWGQASTKPMMLKAGNSYILSAGAVDLIGDGWLDIPSGDYTEQEQNIKGSDCVILLRMDTFVTAEDAEREAEARQQENRAKISARP